MMPRGYQQVPLLSAGTEDLVHFGALGGAHNLMGSGVGDLPGSTKGTNSNGGGVSLETQWDQCDFPLCLMICNSRNLD